METIRGYLERITFQNPQNGYTVAYIKIPKHRDLVCIVGTLPSVSPGEMLCCRGNWKVHLAYGKQFDVVECTVELPADIIGIKKYLGSGLIPGIGHVYAERIVEHFGVETLNIIDNEPEKLYEIKGLGKNRIKTIIECWKEQQCVRQVMIFLQSHGISPTHAQKIYKAYGNLSIQKLKENPYSLSKDIFGIGFKTADSIAEKFGIEKESSQRIDAGIEYVLNELSSDGHVCYPLIEFLLKTETVLEVPKSLVEQRLPILHQEGRIELFDLVNAGIVEKFIWLKSLFTAEIGIVREIKRLYESTSHLRQIDIQKALKWVQEKLGIQLAQNQKDAVSAVLVDKMHIITGGPGTGKSTITNAILHIVQVLTKEIQLAAPTGRAAKRMSEITGMSASTIHSLLEFDFKQGKFKRNRSNPLECDLIIVDEASMIDTFLMYNLLKAIPSHARVIFVGDIHQLPSVGPGNVLKDIIHSHFIPVTTLNEIFRQAAGSRIITNAHRINNGSFPDISNHPGGDFFFLEAEEVDDVLNHIVTLVSQRLPKKYGYSPFQDIQVLAPMKRGVIGIENLNTILQEKLNPKENGLQWGGKKFSIGDKVMQIRNNYERNVFNGDIGRIVNINNETKETVVLIDDREIKYSFSNLDELVLSYAVSIHKYQGSECPCIVIPVHTTHFMLLNRNLLYTGVTRGKKLVVLVGTKKALSIAVKNDEVKKRYTGLQQALADQKLSKSMP